MGQKNRRWVISNTACALLLACLVLILTGSLCLQAQDAAQAAPKGASLWELFRSTGLIGWFLVACSIVGTTFVIEGIMTIRMDHLAPPYLINELEKLLEDQQFDEVMNLCETDNSFLANVVSGFLSRLGGGYEEMRKGLEESLLQEGFKLEARISYINLIGQLGPMLGLLGTVSGMIGTFQVIAAKAVPTPTDLAAGIYESLVNTVMGLAVAIIFLTSYFILKNKVTKASLSIGIIASELLERCKAVQD